VSWKLDATELAVSVMAAAILGRSGFASAISRRLKHHRSPVGLSFPACPHHPLTQRRSSFRTAILAIQPAGRPGWPFNQSALDVYWYQSSI